MPLRSIDGQLGHIPVANHLSTHCFRLRSKLAIPCSAVPCGEVLLDNVGVPSIYSPGSFSVPSESPVEGSMTLQGEPTLPQAPVPLHELVVGGVDKLLRRLTMVLVRALGGLVRVPFQRFSVRWHPTISSR